MIRECPGSILQTAYYLILCTVVILSICAQAINVLDERGDSEMRLVYDLFDKNGYNPLLRPVKHENHSLEIGFNLALSQIIHLDEVNQVMKTNVWLQVYWVDYQLSWDPNLYDNIQSIKIKPEKIWIPDFVLFNNALGNFEVTYKSNCVMYADAVINWIPPAIYHSSCSIDVEYFPFDQQTCDMKFGSWTHKGKSLKYRFYKGINTLILTDYLKSGSWDIIDCPGWIDTKTDEINGDDKEQIIFRFVLRRKTLFYTVNLIIPCVLISFVTVYVFALPADAGEKMALCISLLLALALFLLLVSKILPPSLTIPLIAKYLLFTFIMNLVAIFYTVVILNRNYRTPRTHTMPQWIRIIFLKELPKYLLMTRPDHNKRWQNIMTPTPSLPSTPETRRLNLNISNDFLEVSDVHGPRSQMTPADVSELRYGHTRNRQLSDNRPTPGASMIEGSSHHDSESPSEFVMTPELHNTIESVRFMYSHLKSEKEYEAMLEDWKYVARVLDRLFLFIFLFVTLCGTAGILLNAPHILEFVDQDKIIQDLVAKVRELEAIAAQNE
uniref:Uncharacterized protein n=1 Tax=Arion vulgaris TaxID=1028688 RepID=A0A0B7AC73_9EUPU